MTTEGAMCEYDPELLIEEVKKRPALWNYSIPEYNYKEFKVKCWEEIVDVFNKNENATTYERLDLGRQLQRKWKSLRDCFSREVSRRKKMATGELAHRKRTYLYYKNLQFLLTNKGEEGGAEDAENGAEDGGIDTEDTTIEEEPNAEDDSDEEYIPTERKRLSKSLKSRLKVEAHCESDSEVEEPAPSSIKKSKVHKTKKSKTIEVPITIPDSYEDSIEMDTEKMFLLSLVKPLKRVPSHMRLQVQMEMMSVIQNALTNATEFVVPEGADYDED